MHIIIVRNYKRKIACLAAFIAFWALILVSADYFLDENLTLHITVDHHISFSYPLSMDISDIYINDRLSDVSIDTNYTFRKPAEHKFSALESTEEQCVFDCPTAIFMENRELPGNEILYHITFHDSTGKQQGFVQVWKLTEPVEQFLTQAKRASDGSAENFRTSRAGIGNTTGYLWNYSFLGEHRTYYKGSELFFKKDDRLYRFSYFVPENQWSWKQEKTFWKMAGSFKVF